MKSWLLPIVLLLALNGWAQNPAVPPLSTQDRPEMRESRADRLHRSKRRKERRERRSKRHQGKRERGHGQI